MSTDKHPNAKHRDVRVQVVCEKATGIILAAGPIKPEPMGDDSPTQISLVPGVGETCVAVRLTRDQAVMPASTLFATHIVKKGRLVPDPKAR